MENSIEHIWKNGFLNDKALVAPKINDLYNQKSKNLVVKIKRMMRINVYVILVFTVGTLILYYSLGFGYIGLFIAVLLLYVVYVSKKQWKTMEEINLGESSYAYLSAFDNWLQNSIKANIKLMRFFYPAMFLAAISTILISIKNEKSLSDSISNSDFYLVQGIPLFMIVGVLVIAGIISYFSDRIYMLDLNLVYGSVFKKLKNTIADMEELMAGDK